MTSRKHPLRFCVALVLASVLAAGPRSDCSPGCPRGELPVNGVCYPVEALHATDGAVPLLCSATCSGESPHCDFRSGQCVACRDDADCPTSTAPRCDPTARACVGCSSNASCARFADAPYCERADGRCRACNREQEREACGDYSCDAASGRCSSTRQHSRLTCESCGADSDCVEGQRCVELGWTGTIVEHVCLWSTRSMLCAAAASSGSVPYYRQVALPSVHGGAVEVCAPPAPCAAVRAYLERRRCTTTSECGAPAHGAACLRSRCAMACWFYPPIGQYRGCLAGDECELDTWCVADTTP